jgi:hypothetical protein
VIVTGIAYEEDDIVTCKFGKTVVDGLYINDTQSLCVTPPARVESTVEFTIEVRRGALNLTGGARFQYSKSALTTIIITSEYSGYCGSLKQ